MFVEGELGIIMEEIMSQIKEHLKEDEPNRPKHYNRTYEVILQYLRKYIKED